MGKAFLSKKSRQVKIQLILNFVVSAVSHGLMITKLKKRKDTKLANVLKMKMDWLGAKWFVMMVWFEHGRWFRPRFQTARQTPLYRSLPWPHRGFHQHQNLVDNLLGDYWAEKISTDSIKW